MQSADLTRIRFENPGHPYPNLIAAGLGHIWTGPKRTDFSPAILGACKRHLAKHQKPNGRGDCIRCLNNKILQEDWVWLEALEEEAKGEQGSGEAVEQASPPPPPKTLAEMTDDERQAALSAIRKARKAAKGDSQ